jgi:hypothetical protein
MALSAGGDLRTCAILLEAAGAAEKLARILPGR